MSSLILVKIIVTMVAVVGLSLVAERISTRLAGVLAGFPHGIAIVLYFIGVEQGAEFAAQAAQFATAGLGANVVLAYTYARLSRGRGPGQAAWAALGAIAAFLGVAFVIVLIQPGPALSVILTMLAIAGVRLLLTFMPVDASAVMTSVRPGELVLRALLAAAIVVLITGLAALLGPGRAGILAGFPVVTFPLLLILHARHGAVFVRRVVRHYPFGILSLVVYTLTASWGFSTLGVGWGTLAGLGAALAYLSLASVSSSAIAKDRS
ncbi:MAG TPA: hypothetical protein ENK28_14970 [Aliiroseovarius sp.]|nr:hypothetical protein [Aliiroseovarius sp.]